MDESARNLYEIQMERFEVFKAQDPAHDDFDVVFEIDGEKLYSTKFMLCSISPTMKAMLSERWTKPNEPITIKDYTFNDFKQFITFINSGTCELTNNNIFAMIDIAEFYGVKVFKKSCESFLTKTIIDMNNVDQMIELAAKYSLDILTQSVAEFISKNLRKFIKLGKFSNLQMPCIVDIAKSTHDVHLQETLFETVYKWAENRATEKRKINYSLNFFELIRHELIDVLPYLCFERMNPKFFMHFITNKPFLFCRSKLNHAFRLRCKKLIKVSDANGNILKGELPFQNYRKVLGVIRSQKNAYSEFCESDLFCYWNTKRPKLLNRSMYKKNKSIRWYLVYDNEGDMCLKHNDQLVKDDYLLAQMYANGNFNPSDRCTIDNYSFP